MNSHRSGSEESTAFGQLAEPVRRWIWDKGWPSLRDIQERAIPVLLHEDSDVIIAAATAGGKTEAAFLPLISSVVEEPGHGGFDLVYVGPLRALINDQFERMEDLCSRADLPVYPWHGDISQGVKTRARKDPRGVLLITPESLEALFILRGIEVPALFLSTRAIVIDELHALLDNERGVHLRSLLTRLELAVGRRIRRIGLSATLSEMTIVKDYLRPGSPEKVMLLESSLEGQHVSPNPWLSQHAGRKRTRMESLRNRQSLSICFRSYAARRTWFLRDRGRMLNGMRTPCVKCRRGRMSPQSFFRIMPACRENTGLTSKGA